MSPARCLEWCHDVKGISLDQRTARNALEFLLANAAKAAQSDADHDAIETARLASQKALTVTGHASMDVLSTEDKT